MKKLFKAFMLTFLFAVSALMMSNASMAASLKTVDFIVNYEENLMMAKYDVMVLIDGEDHGSLSNGHRGTLTLDLYEGDHEIEFRKVGAQAVNGKKTFSIMDDATVDITIHSNLNNIEVKKLNVTGLSGKSADTSKTSLFTYDISYEENLLMAKYDIDVYVDGEYCTTLINGQRSSGSFEIKNGTHEFKFAQSGKQANSTVKTYTITGDTSFKCSIKSHTSSIELRNINTNAG